MELGAWLQKDGVYFRVWAPSAETVNVILEPSAKSFSLKAEPHGYFSVFVPGISSGSLYKYQINNGPVYPDPCSRYQPQGPHGPSMVIDPSIFQWQDDAWQKQGVILKGQVIYEVHVGTFSEEGTYQGLANELDELKELGITVIELMPLAEFPGRWNWGYDGVSLFAPAHVYGTPDDLRSLINQAHQVGLAVILDVVYNHLGPDGNYLGCFSRDYFTTRYKNEWGEPINFDGPRNRGVRDFFISNACYWIKEFHFDGLRLDATQSIYDKSPQHILAELCHDVRETASPKNIIILGENEPQDVQLITSVDKGGYGLDGLLNDDFHHTAKVALTGKREAYYKDYLGTPQEFISLLKYGFLYQGQFYSWQGKCRGTFVKDYLKAYQFVNFLQNHDQIANSLDGVRFHEDHNRAVYRALTALLLLSPQTPYLFMGQEFASSSPFLFFTDHNKEIGPKVSKGRKEFLFQFPSVKAGASVMVDPQDEKAFYLSKLKFEERRLHEKVYQMHKDLLILRKKDEVIRLQDRSLMEGSVLSDSAFLIRYTGQNSDRLLVVNLGKQLNLRCCPQPLLAPLSKGTWDLLWSSEEVCYGGRGTVKAFSNHQWDLPAHCTQLFITNDERI